MNTLTTNLLTAFLAALLLVSLGNTQAIGQQEQTSDQQTAESNLTDEDRLQIVVQKICPVSGSELGSMGEPVKVRVGEQIAYLCCAGCQGKNLDANHWATIQQRIAAAQGICPIMEQPVNATKKSTVVNGRQVFVCCPPCIPKIQADIDGSLAKVNSYNAAFIAKERQITSDKIHASAQAICPVTGNELGSMGEPVKVKVGEEVAFLCSKECVDQKIKAEHWMTIQTNLAAAQKICPVMQQPINATKKSTIVNGRKIFVCCPPCIAKIEADPATYVAKLDAQILDSRQESSASQPAAASEHSSSHNHDQ